VKSIDSEVKANKMASGGSHERLGDATVLQATSGQVSCDLGEESVILDLNASQYYGLNPVAAQIWKWLQQPARFDALVARLTEEYDVQAGQARQDLESILGLMRDKGLIEIRHEEAG
jgi:hypothetical protein